MALLVSVLNLLNCAISIVLGHPNFTHYNKGQIRVGLLFYKHKTHKKKPNTKTLKFEILYSTFSISYILFTAKYFVKQW